VSVRWCPLLSTHSPKRFWKFCFTRCSTLGEIAATSSLMFCFKSTVVLGFFSYTLLLRYPQRKKYCDWGHSFQWILKCRRNILWVKTESLFLKYVSTAKARCSTDQHSMATEMLWVSVEERSRTNSPRQRSHSQLCYQIVRYFCRTLYLGDGSCKSTLLNQLSLQRFNVVFLTPYSTLTMQWLLPFKSFPIHHSPTILPMTQHILTDYVMY